MSSISAKAFVQPRLSAKAQTLAAISAIAAAVALPQVFHLMGAMSGLGTGLGEAFLPMHLPILLAGLFAGPLAGAAAGALSPLISHMLTAMPGQTLLPFMCIELCVYGLTMGLMRGSRIPTIAKLLTAQISGRAVRAAAILISVYAFGNANIAPAIIWTSIGAGIFGLALQWVLIPLIVRAVDNIK